MVSLSNQKFPSLFTSRMTLTNMNDKVRALTPCCDHAFTNYKEASMNMADYFSKRKVIYYWMNSRYSCLYKLFSIGMCQSTNWTLRGCMCIKVHLVLTSCGILYIRIRFLPAGRRVTEWGRREGRDHLKPVSLSSLDSGQSFAFLPVRQHHIPFVLWSIN